MIGALFAPLVALFVAPDKARGRSFELQARGVLPLHALPDFRRIDRSISRHVLPHLVKKLVALISGG